MLISQAEGYFIKTKINSNFAPDLAEMLNEATIYFCLFDESHFSNNLYFLRCVSQDNLYKLINCLNIGKKSEAANSLVLT